MSTTADRLRRLLSVIPRLADGQDHAIADVAARVGADPSEVLRDLHELSDRPGDPPGWVAKIDFYIDAERVTMGSSRHFRRPMRLSRDEWQALELGLAMLRAERAPDERPVVDSALAKVRQLAAESEPDAEPVRAATLGAERHSAVIASLKSAMRDRNRVELSYQKGDADAPDARTVCPISLAVEQGAWYLVAHCDRSEGVRIFRLDRVVELKVLGETFDVSPELNVEDLLADGHAFVGDPPERLRVRYSPRVARWVAERERGTTLPDGSLEVELPLGDRSWAVRHVLQYGPDAEVLAPEDVRAEITRRLAALSA